MQTEQNKVQKYKYEDTHWLKCERKPRFQRYEKYEHFEPIWTEYEDTNEMNNDCLVEKILKSETGCNIDGRAGTGKTHFCKRLIEKLKEQGKRIMVLAPTNKSAFIIGGITYHKFFTSIKHNTKKMVNRLDYIFVDEISMIHERFYKAFLTLRKINPTPRFIMAGDFRQLEPVNDRIKNANFKSAVLKQLCDHHRLTLTFCRRSDKELFQASLNVKKIDPSLFQSKVGLINLCYTNKMRHFLNQQCSDKFVRFKGKKKYHMVLKNGQKICCGMPLIASKTVGKLEICKNEMFKVIKCRKTKNEITVQSECGEKKMILTVEEVSNLFELAFAITVHRSQGSTIESPYCIFEWHLFSKKMKYVAITRATKLNHINIDTTPREQYF